MRGFYLHARLPSFLLFLIAAGLHVLAPHGLNGQETPEIREVPIEKAVKPIKALFRPNSRTTFCLDLRNPTKDELSEVKVRLVQIVGGKERPIAEAKLIKELLANGKVRLVFEKAKDGPKELELADSPFLVQLQVEAKNGDRLLALTRDLQLVILQPRQYLTSDADFQGVGRRLSFELKQSDERKDLTGPQDCPVEILFDPELERAKKGIYKKKLRSGGTVHLSAYDLAGTGFGQGRWVRRGVFRV